jgi:hypothetical protein
VSLSSWHMAFFSPRPLGDWRNALRGVWGLLEVDSAYSAFRSIGPCREWEYQMSGEDEDQTETEHISAALPDVLATNLAPDEYICLDLKANWPSRMLIPALKRATPQWVLGDYSPSCVTLQVGPHDLYEMRGFGDGTYFGKPSLSVVIYDKRGPKQPAAMRDKVFAVPEVVAFEKELAARFGVVQHVWYWGWEN